MMGDVDMKGSSCLFFVLFAFYFKVVVGIFVGWDRRSLREIQYGYENMLHWNVYVL